MTDTDALQDKVKKLRSRARQAAMDLHDLSEELPQNWERIPEIAGKAHDLHAELAEAQAALKAAK